MKTYTCNAGEKFEIEGVKHVLCGFTLNEKNYAVLISLPDGNRWTEPVEVKDFRNVTVGEMYSVSQGKVK